MARKRDGDVASKITKKVEQHFTDTTPLRDRMDDDYKLFALGQHLPDSPEGQELENEGYRIYTSNEPRTYAQKVISWMVSAKLIVRIPVHDETRHERDIDQMKEKFILGVLNSADDRLTWQGLPTVRDQLAYFDALRGYVTGRCLIAKRPDGTTYVDITPWDSRHVAWGMGMDGLEWICYRIKKERIQIESEYGVSLQPKTDPETEADSWDVYDYYDRTKNCVITEGDRFLKKPTPHGADRVPAFFVTVGSAPPIQSTTVDDTAADHGESVYEASRDVYADHNFVMSVYLELMARSRKPGIKTFSSDGSKVLEEDPHREGSEVSLRSGQEDVQAFSLIETTKDAAMFASLVSGDLQRGTLPHTIFGELPFQLSGFAINTLRQGIDTIIQPRLKALEVAYRQIGHLLSAQYATGRYDSLEVSGYLESNGQMEYFDLEISPEVIAQGCDPEYTLTGDLPQDDQSALAMAQMAREGPVPLLPDLWIRDNMLKIQDADEVSDMIHEQMGERALPEAGLYTLLQSLENRGRSDLAQFYFAELLSILAQKQAQRAQMGIPPTAQPNGAGPQPPPRSGRAGPTAPPQVAPNAALGVPPPAPTPQQGPINAPGTPRPGAQSDATRLANIGLVGPGG
jgi:hypothetical protein